MITAKANKELFKEYMERDGIATNTINNYSSALNSRVTDAVRTICNVDLGSIFAVIDARLLTHWLKVLKESEGFISMDREWNGSPHAAMKKYIEYVKHLSKQS